MTDKTKRDELLSEWADCGDGYDEGKMLRRLVDELDKKDAEIARLLAKYESKCKCGSHKVEMYEQCEDCYMGFR